LFFGSSKIATTLLTRAQQVLRGATGSNCNEFRGQNKLCYFWASLGMPLGGNFIDGRETMCSTCDQSYRRWAIILYTYGIIITQSPKSVVAAVEFSMKDKHFIEELI